MSPDLDGGGEEGSGKFWKNLENSRKKLHEVGNGGGGGAWGRGHFGEGRGLKEAGSP